MPLILRALVLAALPVVMFASQETAWQPDVRWSRELGEGFSGFAEAGGVLVTMYRRGGDEVIVALDRANGTTKWAHAYAASPLKEQDLSQGPGPHAAPAASGSLACAAGASGRLTCLDAQTGRMRWTRELITGLGGTPVYRGYSSTPVIDGTRVIAQVGGDGRALVAFDAATGKELWRAGSFANTNSSPLRITAGGRPQVIAFLVDVVASFDPLDGRLLWSHPHPQRFNDNISPPLWLPDERLVVVSSALDGGTRALRIGERGVTEAWHQPRAGSYYTNVMRTGGLLVLSSGGVGPTFFTGLDVRTGAIAWQSRDVKRANGVVSGGRLVLRDEEGGLVAARVGPEGVTVQRHAQILEAGAPSPPLLVDDMVYVRDRKRAMAIAVGQAADQADRAK